MSEVSSPLPPGTYTLETPTLTVTGTGGIYGAPGYAATYERAHVTIIHSYATAGGNGVDAPSPAQINVESGGVIKGGAGGAGISAPYFSSDGAAGGIGIDFASSGQLTNSGFVSGGAGGDGASDAGGVGGAGVVFNGFASVTNYGLIFGGNGGSGTPTSDPGGDGIDLDHGGTVVDAGAGVISGGNGGVGGVGVDLANGGKLDIGQDATVSGGASYTPGAAGGAGVDLNGGTLTTAGRIEGGTGGAGGTQGDSVLFGPSSATMIVDLGAQFYGAVGGFQHGDTIDLLNVPLSDVTSSFNSSTDTLSVYTQLDGTLQFAGDPKLLFSSNGEGGTQITCACFRRGTLILTEHGDRPVESLGIGDRVMTLSGEIKPIRWIGRRHYSAQTLLGRPDVMPVLVRAGALGDHLPKRDLWVSPEHALYLRGSLVPAGLLTDGVSILTDHSVGSVSYYHLEFESHEVLFAEGVPAESFVDDDSRQMFDNAADYAFRYPDAPRKNPIFCAPRMEDGEELEALRANLAELGSSATAVLIVGSKLQSRISS